MEKAQYNPCRLHNFYEKESIFKKVLSLPPALCYTDFEKYSGFRRSEERIASNGEKRRKVILRAPGAFPCRRLRRAARGRERFFRRVSGLGAAFFGGFAGRAVVGCGGLRR